MKFIFQVNTIEEDKIHPSLLEQVQKINWRMQTKNFIELYIDCPHDVIEGIALSWTNPNHPTAKYIKVISIERNQILMEQLLIKIAPFHKVIYSCDENRHEEITLLFQNEFQLFRKTYMESYQIADLLKRIPNKVGSESFVTLQYASNSDALAEELFRQVKHNYEQTHLDNPVKDIPWQAWRDLLLDDCPDVQLSKIVLKADEIIGYLFVHPTSISHCEIGWVGKKQPFDLNELLKYVLIEMQKKQFISVEFEVDTTDYFAYEFADLLELHKKPSRNSYVLNSSNP